MAGHTTILRTRGSSDSVIYSRPDFKIWWFVRASGASPPAGFPGDEYYTGIGYAPNLGIHSRTVQATVQSDWTGAFANGPLNYAAARFVVADWEGGGESASDMQNILTWLRSAGTYNGTKLGIYGGRQCAMNANPSFNWYWDRDSIATYQADNDSMVGAVTGTGDATCNVICPELYANYNIDTCLLKLKMFVREKARLGITTSLVPMLNPYYPPSRAAGYGFIKGSYFRGLLEACIREPTVTGVHIWHGDRSQPWSESEDWFVQLQAFISAYGLTVGNLTT
jgi:hypothetical protein